MGWISATTQCILITHPQEHPITYIDDIMTNRLGRLRSRLRSSAADDTLPLSAAALLSSRSTGQSDKGKQHYCLPRFLSSGKSIFLTVGALALFTLGMIKNYEPTSEKSYDAVIVGAGWAGIKAAATLLENGVENILVLEGSDYIGGR